MAPLLASLLRASLVAAAILAALSAPLDAPVVDVNLLEYDLEHEKSKRSTHYCAP